MICGVLKKDGKECQMKVTASKGCRYHSSSRKSPKRSSSKRSVPKEVFVLEQVVNYEDRVLLEVFGSREKAEKRAHELIRETGKRSHPFEVWSQHLPKDIVISWTNSDGDSIDMYRKRIL